MYVDWSEPASVIKFIVIIILIVALVFGALYYFSEKNWKRLMDVSCEVKADSVYVLLQRNSKSVRGNYIEIVAVTLKITPTTGESFEYVFEPGEFIYYESSREYTLTFEEIFEKKSNEVKTVKSCKVTKVELHELD